MRNTLPTFLSITALIVAAGVAMDGRASAGNKCGFSNTWPLFEISQNVEDRRGRNVPLPRPRPSRPVAAR